MRTYYFRINLFHHQSKTCHVEFISYTLTRYQELGHDLSTLTNFSQIICGPIKTLISERVFRVANVPYVMECHFTDKIQVYDDTMSNLPSTY